MSRLSGPRLFLAPRGAVLADARTPCSKIIRHSLARAVAAISDLELIAQPPQWPTLLPFLSQHAHSPNATAREISIFTLFTILDCIHDAFDLPGRQQGAGQNPFWELFGLFGQALGDAESEDVRVDALRALGKMAEYIGADQKDLVVSGVSAVDVGLALTRPLCRNNSSPSSRQC